MCELVPSLTHLLAVVEQFDHLPPKFGEVTQLLEAISDIKLLGDLLPEALGVWVNDSFDGTVDFSLQRDLLELLATSTDTCQAVLCLLALFRLRGFGLLVLHLLLLELDLDILVVDVFELLNHRLKVVKHTNHILGRDEHEVVWAQLCQGRQDDIVLMSLRSTHNFVLLLHDLV